jgi:hypothetical protein
MVKGTPISSPIISNNGNPTHYDEFGVGGYREVSTKNDSASLAKLGKGANITTDVLLKICEYLKCDISDIVEVVKDEDADEVK